MAKHRAECPKTNTPLLRRGATTALITTMLLGGLTAAPAAFADTQSNTPAPVIQDEQVNQEAFSTIRATFAPDEDGRIQVEFDGVEDLTVEEVGFSIISSSVNGVSTSSSNVYTYVATADTNDEFNVEVLADALAELDRTPDVYVVTHTSEAGMLRFSVYHYYTPDNAEEEEVEEVETATNILWAHITPVDDGYVAINFTNLEGAEVQELEHTEIAASYNGVNHTHSATFKYEVTLDEDVEFVIETITDALTDLGRTHEAEVDVTSSEPGFIAFSITVTTLFEYEDEVVEEDQQEEVVEEQEEVQVPEVVDTPVDNSTEETPEVEALAVIEDEVDEVTITVEEVEDSQEDAASTFQLSSTTDTPAQDLGKVVVEDEDTDEVASSTTTQEDEVADTPANDLRDGRSGGGQDAQSGSGSSEPGQGTADVEPGVNLDTGADISTNDRLPAPTQDADSATYLPNEVEQERLADTGVDMRIGIFAALSLALGGAFIALRSRLSRNTA